MARARTQAFEGIFLLTPSGSNVGYSMNFINRFLKLHDGTRSIASKLVTRLSNATALHCLGDSHTMVFEQIAQRRFWWHTRFYFCIVQGATVSGFANPHSQTQADPIFKSYIGKLNAKEHLLFCMGEVDCGFVIWYRAQKYGDSIEAQMDLAVSNYIQLIDWCIARGFQNIILCSSPLPTILDGQVWGEVANKRREVTATLRERTDLTRAFNKKVREYCSSRNIKYLDFEADTLDQDTQVVKNEFRNKNHFDHHLDSHSLSDLLIPKLKKMGYF
jgi:hypothetical protein